MTSGSGILICKKKKTGAYASVFIFLLRGEKFVDKILLSFFIFKEKKDSLAGVALPCIPFNPIGVWLPRN